MFQMKMSQTGFWRPFSFRQFEKLFKSKWTPGTVKDGVVLRATECEVYNKILVACNTVALAALFLQASSAEVKWLFSDLGKIE